MGERDNHIATSTSPQSRGGLLTHYHGEKERVLDREVQPRSDGGGGSHGVDDGQRPLGPLLPWSWCCNGGASAPLVGLLIAPMSPQSRGLAESTKYDKSWTQLRHQFS